jgi:hypothetical protein
MTDEKEIERPLTSDERANLGLDKPKDTNATVEPRRLKDGWIGEAPRRVDFAIESTVVVNEPTGRAYPAVAFAFGGKADEPITAVFVSTPENMLLLAKHVKKAVDDARKGASHARAELGRRRLEAELERASKAVEISENEEIQADVPESE